MWDVKKRRLPALIALGGFDGGDDDRGQFMALLRERRKPGGLDDSGGREQVQPVAAFIRFFFNDREFVDEIRS